MELLYDNEFYGKEVKLVSIRNEFRNVLVAAGEISDSEESIKGITSQKVLSRLTRLGFKKAEKRTGNKTHVDISKKIFEHQAFVYLKHREEIQEIFSKEKLKPELSSLESTILKTSTKEDNPTPRTKLTNLTKLTEKEVKKVNLVKNVRFGEGGHEDSKTEKLMQFLTMLQLEENGDPIFEGDLIELGIKNNLSSKFIEKTIELWKRDGIVFSPKKNYIKIV